MQHKFNRFIFILNENFAFGKINSKISVIISSQAMKELLKNIPLNVNFLEN